MATPLPPSSVSAMSIPSRNVAFIKPDEPSFLKKFKAKVGYKAPATIEDKKERKNAPEEDDGAEVEREDEQPTVVQLKPGDIGPAEYEAYRQSMKDKQDKDDDSLGIPTVEPRPTRPDDDSASSEDSGGKILFKKPMKRKSSESGGGGGGGVLDASSSKRARQGEGEGEKGSGRRRRRSSGGESQSKGVKNKSLLSFGDDEED